MRLKFKHGIYTNKGIKRVQPRIFYDNDVIKQRQEQLIHLVGPKVEEFEEIDKSERKRKIINKKSKPIQEAADEMTEKERQSGIKYKDAKIIRAPKTKKEDPLGNKCYPKFVPRAQDLPLISGFIKGKKEFKLYKKGYLYACKELEHHSSFSDYDQDSNERLEIADEINRIEVEDGIAVDKYKIKTLG